MSDPYREPGEKAPEKRPCARCHPEAYHPASNVDPADFCEAHAVEWGRMFCQAQPADSGGSPGGSGSSDSA